jgi:hypothetical protein
MATFQTFQKEEQRRKKAALKRGSRGAGMNASKISSSKIKIESKPIRSHGTSPARWTPLGDFKARSAGAAPQIKEIT